MGYIFVCICSLLQSWWFYISGKDCIYLCIEGKHLFVKITLILFFHVLVMITRWTAIHGSCMQIMCNDVLMLIEQNTRYFDHLIVYKILFCICKWDEQHLFPVNNLKPFFSPKNYENVLLAMRVCHGFEIMSMSWSCRICLIYMND